MEGVVKFRMEEEGEGGERVAIDEDLGVDASCECLREKVGGAWGPPPQEMLLLLLLLGI